MSSQTETKSTKLITLIRHAESKFNNGEAKGSDEDNCRLSDNGIKQAQGLEFKFDLLVISPLKRALETYINSSIKVKNVEINLLFREWITNGKSGLNFLELEERKTESKDELSTRVDSCIKYLKKSTAVNIGVISHYDFLKALCNKLFGSECKFGNCSYFTFEL
jgi:broad specificity phosphatase PhoE